MLQTLFPFSIPIPHSYSHSPYPPPHPPSLHTLLLTHPSHALLTQVYEKANSVAIQEVHAPQWLHRFIIGRKGQNVQKITQDLPKVHVEFNSSTHKIVLEGPPEQVQQAKEAFDTFTEDLVSRGLLS